MKQYDKNVEKTWIVFVGSFPPRECGIATFTADLVRHFDEQFVPREETKVVAMNVEDTPNPPDSPDSSDAPDSKNLKKVHQYSEKVIFQISENNVEDYKNVARELNNMPHVRLISIQHEFGIFGKNDGEQILAFLDELKKSVTVTFHTVLSNPSENQKRIVCSILEKVQKVIVMTRTSEALLQSVYGAQADKIKVIPHGIHSRPYTLSDNIKKEFEGFEGRRIVSTFGLLNRGKGIEFAIDALPHIVKRYPDVLYAVIGATHPVVLRREGPVYLNTLKEQVRTLGMEKHVVFFDTYIETPELLKMLQATDIYLSLSQNPDQAVSGTLTYALGMGRPVISTPFAQAKEVLTPDLGLLVEFNDSALIADRVLTLLNDQGRLMSMSRTAYFRTRSMTWANVALSYMREFKKLSPELAQKEKSVPRIKLDHLKRMTDDFGIFQFAVLTEPDPSSGYTIDDNARALVATCWYARILSASLPAGQSQGQGLEWGQVENQLAGLSTLAETYLNFLCRASKQNRENVAGQNREGQNGEGFENYFDADHTPNQERNTSENLEDANARACWALAVVATCKTQPALQTKACELFEKQYQNDALSAHGTHDVSNASNAPAITSPRAMAFHIKALSLWIKANPQDTHMKAKLIFFADILSDLYKRSVSVDWLWFEERMTYSNAVLPEALLLAYATSGNESYYKIGKESLDFLIKNSFNGEVCVPVGQRGWFKHGSAKELFDQQPEEVSALVLALQTMYEISKDEQYIKIKEKTFNWFLGNNLLDQVIYSQMSGGCYDGVGDGYINLNQGAESTISYLLARACM